ncbi:MAG: hypothetical protein LBV45_04475 [Xanthomonadaceae bacterium]|jgi:hypothetical protein|nr:hypothetical protein [Xanthomonadaceae bacterium]
MSEKPKSKKSKSKPPEDRPVVDAAAGEPLIPPEQAAGEEPQSYSIVLRVRRVVYEDGYVSVPVDDTIVKRREDGHFAVNPDAFLAEAVRIAQDPQVEWIVEERAIEAHPTQCVKPADRRVVDGSMIKKSD